MRCDGCKHWDGTENRGFADLGRCVRAEQFWDATEWVKEGSLINARRAYRNEGDLMFTQDASDYRADLLTRAAFGCVLFEATP